MEGGIHYLRSSAGPTCRLAKLLRHRWHRGGHADGLDVRGHHLDGTAPGAPVVVMEPCEGLQHLHGGAFWYRAADRRASERTLAGTLDGCFAARPGWSGGVSYVLIVLWEVRHRLVGYQLVRSDWLWYTLLPLISYSALVVAAILLPIFPGPVLFIIAAVTLLLLFMGIHNAWDVVTYMAIEHSQPQETSQD